MARRDDPSRRPAEVWLVEGHEVRLLPDELAVEEPLQIRLVTAAGVQSVAVTMRTPGADRELAAGFLFAEGLVEGPDDLCSLAHPVDGEGREAPRTLDVTLRPGLAPDPARLERHFTVTAACGLCGKVSLAGVDLARTPRLPAGPFLDPGVLHRLPAKLEPAQGVFQATGGLHAAALFDAGGELLAVREDVGRHNALDKLLGWALLARRLPLHDHLVLVSGRASYELVQKCLMAEVPVLCAVSAPSSLAAALAHEHGATLVGFLRDGRFNVYTGRQRLLVGAPAGR